MNRNYTQAARQDAGGRLLPSLIFALGGLCSFGGDRYVIGFPSELHHDIQCFPCLSALPFPLAAHGFHVLYFL